MHAYCTYCSASKDPSTGLVPAYKRYISDRIIRVQPATPLSWKQIMELAAEAGQKLKLDRVTGDAEFEKLLSFYPKDGMIYLQRALAYEAVGEYDRAKADYEKSKQYFPLDRWKWEAQKALDALEQKMSAGGTIAEAKRRIKAMKKGDQSLQNEILAALSKVESDPKSAAVGLRSCLEVLVDRLYSSFGRKAEGDLADKIANLRSKSVPEMVLDHMHTIRRIGNRGSHRRQPGEPPLKLADVYSSATALVAVLEWLEERK